MNRIVLALGLAFVVTLSPTAAPAAPAQEPAPSDEIFTVDPVEYGSGFASNCSCSFCIKYCTVNGVTYKNGLCC